MSTEKNIQIIPVLDGGRGWWLVLAGAMANFVSMGLYRSGGIIYLASVKTFSASRTAAAWVPMVTMMVVFLTAPVGTVLAKRFTFHSVVFMGGLISFAGMMLGFASDRLEILFCGWSVVFGLGSSLAFFPTLAIVGQSFRKKRPLANGFVLAGGAVGCSCLPPLLEYFIEFYGLNETCLILSAFVLHYCIGASLLYSVSNWANVNQVQQKTSPMKMSLLVDKNKEQVIEFNDHKSENTQKLTKQDYELQNIKESVKILECETDTQKSRSCLHKVVGELDLSVVKNCTFLTNCFSNAIQTALFFGLVIILPDFGEDEVGVTRIEGAYFVSASAIADLVSRLVSGFILTKLNIRKSILYVFILIINAVDFLIFAYARTYSVIVAASVLGGACFASGMILYFEILASCQSPNRYPMAFGLSEMMKTPFVLAAATSVGSFKDATGSYTTTFLIFAIAELVAAALWIGELLHNRRKTNLPITSSL